MLPEMSPLGLILEFDILCPSGILKALTIPFPSKAELKTLQEQAPMSAGSGLSRCVLTP